MTTQAAQISRVQVEPPTRLRRRGRRPARGGDPRLGVHNCPGWRRQEV